MWNPLSGGNTLQSAHIHKDTTFTEHNTSFISTGTMTDEAVYISN